MIYQCSKLYRSLKELKKSTVSCRIKLLSGYFKVVKEFIFLLMYLFDRCVYACVCMSVCVREFIQYQFR